jgi:hypothetical protein
MKSATATGRVRCAIYTRVSTARGLDQDFNSRDSLIWIKALNPFEGFSRSNGTFLVFLWAANVKEALEVGGSLASLAGNELLELRT